MIPSTITEVTCPGCKRTFFVELDAATLAPPRRSVTLQVQEGHVVKLSKAHCNQPVDWRLSAVVTHCPRRSLGGNK